MQEVNFELENLVNETLVDLQKLKGYGVTEVNQTIDSCMDLVKINEKNWGDDKRKLVMANISVVGQTMGILNQYRSSMKINVQQLKVLDYRITQLLNLLKEVSLRA